MHNKYMKKCSTSLAIKEIQIKMTLKFQLTPARMLSSIMRTTNTGENARGKELASIVGGNAN
jgi:hypothetical protein